jgi:hypothetical protein
VIEGASAEADVRSAYAVGSADAEAASVEAAGTDEDEGRCYFVE